MTKGEQTNEWVPLSVRRGLREATGLYSGVPEHLQAQISYWLEGVFGYRERGGMDRALIHSVASRAEVRLGETDSVAMMHELIAVGQRDEDVFLDIIDATLSTGHGRAGELRRILDEGRSIWTVADSNLSLIERVDPMATEAYVRAVGPSDVASSELREAWTRLYSRTTDASDSWDHAIKAVEAVLTPIVVPKQAKPTLGHVIGMLDSQPANFSFAVPSADVPTLVSMLRILWPNPDRHASPQHRREPTELEARAVVHLAVLVVQWSRDGIILGSK